MNPWTILLVFDAIALLLALGVYFWSYFAGKRDHA